MDERRVYSDSVEAAVESQIPDTILDALAAKGWNAFGIFELVARELKKEEGDDGNTIKSEASEG